MARKPKKTYVPAGGKPYMDYIPMGGIVADVVASLKHMWIISKQGKTYLLTIGDPTKSSSTLKRRFQSKADVKDWIKYEMAGTVSPTHVLDWTGEGLLPGGATGMLPNRKPKARKRASKNPGKYYVLMYTAKGKYVSTYGPYTLTKAKQFARIGSKTGGPRQVRLGKRGPVDSEYVHGEKTYQKQARKAKPKAKPKKRAPRKNPRKSITSVVASLERQLKKRERDAEKKADPKLMAQAREMGKKAFGAGLVRAPAADKEFSRWLFEHSTGEALSIIPYMKAWTQGWNRANLDAPITNKPRKNLKPIAGPQRKNAGKLSGRKRNAKPRKKANKKPNKRVHGTCNSSGWTVYYETGSRQAGTREHHREPRRSLADAKSRAAALSAASNWYVDVLHNGITVATFRGGKEVKGNPKARKPKPKAKARKRGAKKNATVYWQKVETGFPYRKTHDVFEAKIVRGDRAGEANVMGEVGSSTWVWEATAGAMRGKPQQWKQGEAKTAGLAKAAAGRALIKLMGL